MVGPAISLLSPSARRISWNGPKKEHKGCPIVKRISLGRTLATILLVLALAAVALAKTDHHSFSVSSQFGDRDEFEFEVRDTGTIRVEARWSGSASELA